MPDGAVDRLRALRAVGTKREVLPRPPCRPLLAALLERLKPLHRFAPLLRRLLPHLRADLQGVRVGEAHPGIERARLTKGKEGGERETERARTAASSAENSSSKRSMEEVSDCFAMLHHMPAAAFHPSTFGPKMGRTCW